MPGPGFHLFNLDLYKEKFFNFVNKVNGNFSMKCLYETADLSKSIARL